MTGRTERDLHRLSLPLPYMAQPEIHIHWCGRGLGAGEQTWGEDSCWLCENSLKGLECVLPQLGVFAEEARAAIEVKCHC